MNTVNVTTQNGTALTTNRQWVAVWTDLSNDGLDDNAWTVSYRGCSPSLPVIGD